MSGAGLRQKKLRHRSEKEDFLTCGKTREESTMNEQNILKMFVSSVTQFFNKKNETNLRLVQKHIDNLLNFKLTFKTFDPRSLLVSDCIINLTELLTELGMNEDISGKIIKFFQNLENQSPLLMSIVQSMFNVAFTLITFLSTNLDDPLESVFLPCLSLLQSITKCREDVEDVSTDLVQFLIKNIQCSNKNLLLPSLKLLTNLCRHSQISSQFIKSMDNLKEFYKYLMNLVSNPDDPQITLASLSLTIAVAANEPIFGENFFSPRNLQQVLQLLFNNLGLHTNNPKNFSTTVDLFVHFLDYPGVENRLLKYKHLDYCLSHILDNITPKLNNESISKLLELLNRFCNIDGIKCRMINLILKNELETKHSLPITLAIDRISTNFNEVEATLNSFRFLITVFRAIVSPAPPADLSQQVDVLLPAVLSVLTEPFEVEDLTFKWHCQRISTCFNLLNILLLEPLYRDKILNIVDIKLFRNLLQVQFTRNNLESNSSICSSIDWSNDGVNVVLEIINFLHQLMELSTEAKNVLQWCFQDSLLIPFVGAALSSDCVSRIELGLKIIQSGLCVKNSSFQSLAETLALRNEKPKTKGQVTVTATTNIVSPINLRKEHKVDSNVDELIQKMENGLKVKDIKSSEIMSMYEHKIESFRVKEKHLHNLLEAKSVALQQADKILTQYRCRWAQSDAEALELRALLQESEKRSEAAKDQTTSAMLKQQQMKDEYDQVILEIKKMERITEERNEAFNELADRLENTEKTCTSLKEEIEHAAELNAMLQRHVETHKEKEATLSAKLANLEKEKKLMSKKLKEQETSLDELKKNYGDVENKLKEKNDAFNEKQILVASLQDNLNELEREKRSFQEEIANMEEICGQLEKSLKEKEAKNKLLCEELEKQKQITSLIQNITSGRMDLSMLDGK